MANFMLGYAKRNLPLKQILLLLVVLLISVTVGYQIFNGLKKELKIIDGAHDVYVKTMGESVEEVFGQMGVFVESYDYVSAPLNMSLSNETIYEIFIKRAVPVSIHFEGRSSRVMTYHDTIGETVEANGIVMGPMDRLEGYNLNDPIQIGMEIRVIRVREELITEVEAIPYDIVQKPNDNINQGEQKVIQEGIDGALEKYYKLTYEDGRIVSRSFVDEKVAFDPIEKILEFGTVPNFKTSRGDVVRYTKVLEMNSTAYTSSFECTGKHPDHPLFGICYTGMQAQEGVIAVDPKVIPLHTRVYVEVLGNTPDYGFAYAGDIGSAIKGNLIDVYLDDQNDVKKWGRKPVRVYILKEQNDIRWKTNNYSSR